MPKIPITLKKIIKLANNINELKQNIKHYKLMRVI